MRFGDRFWHMPVSVARRNHIQKTTEVRVQIFFKQNLKSIALPKRTPLPTEARQFVSCQIYTTTSANFENAINTYDSRVLLYDTDIDTARVVQPG